MIVYNDSVYIYTHIDNPLIFNLALFSSISEAVFSEEDKQNLKLLDRDI